MELDLIEDVEFVFVPNLYLGLGLETGSCNIYIYDMGYVCLKIRDLHHFKRCGNA